VKLSYRVARILRTRRSISRGRHFDRILPSYPRNISPVRTRPNLPLLSNTLTRRARPPKVTFFKQISSCRDRFTGRRGTVRLMVVLGETVNHRIVQLPRFPESFPPRTCHPPLRNRNWKRPKTRVTPSITHPQPLPPKLQKALRQRWFSEYGRRFPVQTIRRTVVRTLLVRTPHTSEAEVAPEYRQLGGDEWQRPFSVIVHPIKGKTRRSEASPKTSRRFAGTFDRNEV